MTTKVRLVRCPKCRLVLPELADVPVYKCGSCGAVLQAKVRKTDTNDGPTSNIVQTSPAPKPTPEHASEDIVATNLNQESTIVSSEHAGKNQCEDSTDSVKEPSGYINHSGDPRSSTDISSHENPESSPEGRVLIDSDKEQHGDMNTSELNYYNHENQSPSVLIDVDESICSLDELEDSSRELPAELKDSSQETLLDTNVEENLMKSSAFSSLIAEKLLDSRPRKLASTSQSLVDDDVERSHSSKFQGFEHTGSAKMLESARFNKPTPDLGVPVGGMSKSPTARSYNAYDASISSFEENADQFADSHLIQQRRNYGVRSKEFPKGDNLRGNLGRNQNAMNNRGKWDHEFPGPMRNDHPNRNMKPLKVNDARSSRVPFHERGSRASHGDASSSNLGFSEFQYNPMYHSPVKTSDFLSWKLWGDNLH